MDAIVLRGNNDVGVESIPDPTPLASEVVIEVAATGLCGTDLHEYVSGPTFSQPPVVLGHEISGRIVEVGSGVDRSRIGEGVTVIPMDFCGSCHYCHRALYHLCLRPEWIGLTRDGGLASYTAVPSRLAIRVPDAVDLEAAALTEPTAVAFHGVRRAELLLGETVLVLGAGALGLAVIQSARAAGAAQIYVTEASSVRGRLAQDLGATVVLDPHDPATTARILEETRGAGVDVVFHAAGSPEAFAQGLDCLRKQGRFMEMSSWAGTAPLDVNRHLLKEIQLRMVFGYDMFNDFPAVLAKMADGAVALAPQITTRVPLGRAVVEGLGGLVEGREGLVKVLVKP
ncbi:2,3-butanediol dehydrogenase [Mycobacterium sp. 050128]|uniref:2,3-butanediol dehydrogenase n=1 Tax=Mycobacterium TaxID=1763 RepID=UPI000451875E|nr:2,3-butanediol dehydrogenase [Mycobacterium intracellulare]MBX9639541.1 2,3-butanediol dehydrogenase [Mycobacteriaceae bacterium]ARV80206.1 zinc-binding alcohol dehydrogenase [Mycobacterium intracellulare subsp. chimaera]ASL18851.1 alcohol dehydrogenase [Mycobacterium intracellulare subsp. chimaera]ETZ38654.1 zinc-binding dehydrogenase family protein [Mycobacterium intracellulare MIN_052511_1280]KPN45718.1 zinc-binding alcohol dehydrogenase [Mycobacterium intracellulare subsp. chimaera]